MPTNTIDVAREPGAVFDVLSAPDSYDHWVVGAADIRDADPRWPAPGSLFHHTQGIKGVGLKDTTSVLEVDPGRRLVLEVRARPVLIAEVALDLAPHGTGTRVTMVERPLSGWLARIYNPALDKAVAVRNQISLRRLKQLAERR